MKEDAYLGFSHGFNIHYNLIKVDKTKCFLVAPKAPGISVRELFLKKENIAIAIQNPIGFTVAWDYAKAITNDKTDLIYELNWEEETITDLFGEQAILCGGLVELISIGYQTLIDKGYSHESAYYECIGELKHILKLIEDKGTLGMLDHVSELANIGVRKNGKNIINKQRIEEIFNDLKYNEFKNNLQLKK